MSEKYIQIANFRYGLDSRRSELTSVPGVLEGLTNCFINSGAEVEKRKGFGKSADQFPAISFGLQDTEVGLVTFGSEDPTGITFPVGVTYQRLQHPTGWQKVGAITIPVTMAAVIFSCNYSGKAFVIAQFTDNREFLYYDGALIGESRYGRVLVVATGSETISDLSTDLVANISASLEGWVAEANTTATKFTGSSESDYNLHESALAGTTIIKSPPGVHFTPVPSETSAIGQLGVQHIDQDFPGVSAKAARCAFTITAGGPGDSITVTAPPTSAGGAATAQLTGGAVPYNTSLNQTAADVGAAINANTYITGYSANVSAATITITAPSDWGAVTFNVTVTTTGGMTTAVGVITNAYSLMLTGGVPGGGINVIASGTARSFTVKGTLSASVVGDTGVPPTSHTTYAWQETNADGTTPVTTPTGITMSLATGSPPIATASTVTFSKLLLANTSVYGYFRCVATDSGAPTGSPATVRFTVQLEYDNTL